MKERGILFSASMVRAILAGQKTVTRRTIKTMHPPEPGNVWRPCVCREIDPSDTPCMTCASRFAPAYASAGDRLWVREAWRTLAEYDDRPKRAGVPVPEGSLVWYDANPTPDGEPWTGSSGHDGRGNWHTVGRYRHARFMPRWASRITLDVVSVRVERLHEIDEADAVREGCEAEAHYGSSVCARGARSTYAVLWDTINGAGAWALNPFVWRVEFARAAS